ncbi:hypothetical protein M409DRAFT_61013 [Zasmidium cellare ATCC 36951]|uniref:CENP-V/GFA domain-containing protein n=1 Tax=Zasmidium cellare ATCC 36951 TaxID=1080233 RepID=A0A6A6BWN2_ZASCE|nr:uncharacterized protein M409DRAFT_61013 [Zasmidium cellare ATCC 36951]KAF2159187.1 hypothetical protein M409DRAFT_61013 [Zasmidium cellare ATCC 36951]
MPMTATCHCGSISITAPHLPAYINDCQCGVCHRYGGAWGYYTVDEVSIDRREGASTKKYIWGDRECEFHFCEQCGGVVFWWPTEKGLAKSREMGVNTRMVDPGLLLRVERRWTFVD